MVRIIYLTLIIFFFSSAVFAADMESTTWISGTFDSFYLEPDNLAHKNSYNLELNNHFTKNWHDLWSFESQLDFRSDLAGSDPQEKFLLEPEEFNFQFQHKNLKFIIGAHRENWEGTDLLNPMNLAFAKNFMNPLAPRIRSATGFFATIEAGLSWNLIYIPFQNSPLLPSAKSYWWPRHVQLPLQTDQATLLLPPQIDYQIDPGHINGHAQENNFAVHVSKSLNNFDFSFAYFEGANSTPSLSPVLNASLVSALPKLILQLNSPIEIQPEIYRVRRLASAFTVANNWFIFKFASQWNQPYGEMATPVGSSRLSVFEIEKAFDIGGRDLNLIAEWIESQQADNNNLVILSALLKKGWALGWRFSLKENLIWQAGVYQEVTLHSYIETSQLSLRWNDQWTSDLGVTHLEGSSNSPLGVYRQNDQASLTLKYFFL